VGLGSVKRALVADKDLEVVGRNAECPVIGVKAGSIITAHRKLPVPLAGGIRTADPAADILKICVLERHGKSGNIGRGFVQGFGLPRGALASSVGHDSHNLCVVGSDDGDMALAINHLIKIGGGFAVALDGKILADLPLPVAGLMSLDPYEKVRDNLLLLRDTVRALGCPLPEPFLQLAFLPLPVIPHLKITDRGLVDVDRFCFVALD
jgi:adenine deaminase